MKLGIYIPSLSNKELLSDIYDSINFGLDKKLFQDVSLFYDDISSNPFNLRCGTFNSTDLWNFSGDLIVTSLGCLYSAKNIVNRINLVYYHGYDKKQNIFTMIQGLNIPNKIICKTKEDSDYIYRISGKRSYKISESFKDIIESKNHE